MGLRRDSPLDSLTEARRVVLNDLAEHPANSVAPVFLSFSADAAAGSVISSSGGESSSWGGGGGGGGGDWGSGAGGGGWGGGDWGGGSSSSPTGGEAPGAGGFQRGDSAHSQPWGPAASPIQVCPRPARFQQLLSLQSCFAMQCLWRLDSITTGHHNCCVRAGYAAVVTGVVVLGGSRLAAAAASAV